MTDYLVEGHKALQAAVKKTEFMANTPELVLALADVARAYGELRLIESGKIPARYEQGGDPR